MGFWLGDVPAVMRSKGWTVGAACMERWFERGAYIMTAAEKEAKVDYRQSPASLFELGIATMQWAMHIPRVRMAAEALRTGWLTPRCVANLRSRLTRQGRLAPDGQAQDFRFGDLAAPTIEVNETCQANAQTVGGIFDPFDDYYAAIGRGTLNIAVTGQCRTEKGGGRLLVDGLGVYLRDSYEFLGDQFLGYWNRSGVTSYAMNTEDIPVTAQAGADGDWSIGVGSVSTTVERYYGVSNKSFDDYRTAHSKGGDFIIFTDVMRLPLPNGPVEVSL